jgi:hypothetical protein
MKTSFSPAAIPTLCPVLKRNFLTTNAAVNSKLAENTSVDLPRRPREPLKKPGELLERLKSLQRRLKRLLKIREDSE